MRCRIGRLPYRKWCTHTPPSRHPPERDHTTVANGRTLKLGVRLKAGGRNRQGAWRTARSRLIKGATAGVVQWQNGSFPSCIRGFDSLRPLQSCACVQRKARLPRMTGAIALHPSRALRDLIEKSGDAANPSIADDREIGALDRAVGALRAQPPGEADVVAEAVGLADELKPEIRKALLHAGDQCVNAVMAIPAHQRVDIFRVFGPMLAEDLAPAARRALVPQVDIAAGNRIDVGHFALSFDFRRSDRLTDYRRLARLNRLPRRLRVSILEVYGAITRDAFMLGWKRQ